MCINESKGVRRKKPKDSVEWPVSLCALDAPEGHKYLYLN